MYTFSEAVVGIVADDWTTLSTTERYHMIRSGVAKENNLPVDSFAITNIVHLDAVLA